MGRFIIKEEVRLAAILTEVCEVGKSEGLAKEIFDP